MFSLISLASGKHIAVLASADACSALAQIARNVLTCAATGQGDQIEPEL
jgi:hypothetical protein